MVDLPAHVLSIVDLLAAMPGVVAVVLGGSRAAGTHTEQSDWDLGVYYRGTLDTRALSELGTVYSPGSWGRIMNGGAWLTQGNTKIDVLLRDLDVVDTWSKRAEAGEYEVDALLGYIAGVPTYSLLAERAVAFPLRAELPCIERFPPKLVETAPARWRFHANFSLMHARMRAERGDVVGTVGQVAKAMTEHAHAILCARAAWVLNEKRIIEAAGLAATHDFFSRVPSKTEELTAWVAEVGGSINGGA